MTEMYRMALLNLFLIICIASFGIDSSLAAYDVMQYGATGDGYTDDSKAFVKAWKAACGDSGGSPIMSVPAGKTFLLYPLAFEGPCRSPNLHLQIAGTLMAPRSKNGWSKCQSNSWIHFSGVKGLIINGNGEINGQGSPWWKAVTIVEDESDHALEEDGKGGCDRPTALRFHNCDGLQLSGTNHIDSPRNHISISGSTGVVVSGIRISAPQNSPNTDGIDISTSTQVTIQNSQIGTGDDCVAINSGCSNIYITGISCGPGHGISVGSLGAHGSRSEVEWVRVQNCTFSGTMNGGRIKTWPGGSGYARNIYYQDITLDNVKHPIIIDQHYCNGHQNYCPDQASAVQVSDVHFFHVHGTSAGKEAITVNCSSHLPCQNIMIENVMITPSIGGSEVYSTCKNARGLFFATPKVYCD